MAIQPDGNRPTIVLVHGAWADATGFDPEIRALQREGFRAIAGQAGAPHSLGAVLIAEQQLAAL